MELSMCTKSRLCFALLVVLGIGLLPVKPFAESPDREKPKLKDFGYSLKKLKWDPEKNAAAESSSSNQNSNAAGEDVVRIDTSLVACDLLVLDKLGRTVRGLKASDFAISEDGTPQQVGHFLLGDNTNVSRSIVLIIDYSGSQFPYIKNSVDAAKVLVDKLGPLDRMAIGTDDVELLVDLTNDTNGLKKKVDALAAK